MIDLTLNHERDDETQFCDVPRGVPFYFKSGLFVKCNDEEAILIRSSSNTACFDLRRLNRTDKVTPVQEEVRMTFRRWRP